MTADTNSGPLGLSSATFDEGGTLPTEHAAPAAGGHDQPPELSWNRLPEARSYALTCFDPDAPTGSGVWHWVLADLPATITSLGRQPAMAGRSFINDLGRRGYSGAAPPPGCRHRYEFRVHALDVETLPVPDDTTNAIARFTINAHTLACGLLTATFPGDPR